MLLILLYFQHMVQTGMTTGPFGAAAAAAAAANPATFSPAQNGEVKAATGNEDKPPTGLPLLPPPGGAAGAGPPFSPPPPTQQPTVVDQPPVPPVSIACGQVLTTQQQQEAQQQQQQFKCETITGVSTIFYSMLLSLTGSFLFH